MSSSPYNCPGCGIVLSASQAQSDCLNCVARDAVLNHLLPSIIQADERGQGIYGDDRAFNEGPYTGRTGRAASDPGPSTNAGRRYNYSVVVIVSRFPNEHWLRRMWNQNNTSNNNNRALGGPSRQ